MKKCHDPLLTAFSSTEMVHVLGVDDVNPALDPNDLMTQTLSTGIRRMPTAADTSGAVTASPAAVHSGPSK